MFADVSVCCIVSFLRGYSALFGGFYPLLPKKEGRTKHQLS